MATLGLTKLQAVNRILRAIDELPVAALDPGGASIAARAEEVLDDVRQDILVRGYYHNVVKCQAVVPALDAGQYKATVPSNVLKVRSAGPNQHRNITLLGDLLYDLDRASIDFLSTATVYVDMWLNVAFESMSPDLKSFVANEAATVMQRRWKGSGESDSFLKEETIKSELNTDKVRPGPETPNQFPALTAVQQGQQGR